jgi:glycosyltransferase involved in cell wall biosynthesis
MGWSLGAWGGWAGIQTARGRPPPPPPPGAELPIKPRIAMVCPLAAKDSELAGHCQKILPLLAGHFEIELFVERGRETQAKQRELPFAVFAHTRLAACYNRYAAVVYQLENSPQAAYMLPLLEQFPGVLVMHDAALDVAVETLAQKRDKLDIVASEIIHSKGLQGLLAWLRGEASARQLLLNRHALEYAQHLLLTDEHTEEALTASSNGAWLPPISVLPPDAEPDAAVPAYVLAIESASASRPQYTLRHLADTLRKLEASDQILDSIACHAVNNTYLRKQPRILFDVTQLAKTDARSGIQRVVRNIAREFGRSAALPAPLELVRQEGCRLWRANAVIGSIFEIDPAQIPEQEVLTHPGDVLLMIDSSWEQYAEFAGIFQSVRRFGGTVATVVYDLIPLRRPETCHPGLVPVFQRWFTLAVEHSDMLVCISRSVAEEVSVYLEEQNIRPSRPLRVTYWPLGADLGISDAESAVREQVKSLAADRDSPLFLMVGTVEPRKGHDFVLSVFEQLWARGANIRLCIAGSVGWMVDTTMRRIRSSPQFNKKLFFIEKFTDAEINLCYAASTALIAASVAEGYGLPIVEAALHQVPVLASDIPVFREVGGEGALYFSLDNEADLAQKVEEMARTPAPVRQAMAGRVKIHTWRESAEHLLKVIWSGRQDQKDTFH